MVNLTEEELHRMIDDAMVTAGTSAPVTNFKLNMGFNVFTSIREINGVHLSVTGNWYFHGHQINLDFTDLDRPARVVIGR